MLRKSLTLFFLLWWFLLLDTAQAQTTTDSVYVFRFVPQDEETKNDPVKTSAVATGEETILVKGGILPRDSRFALRADLLRWATLTPDLGVEWRINRNWSIQVNGTWTSWTWDNKNRRYALWEVSPEVRYYIGKERRGYIGASYYAGEFNSKLGATGKQGNLQGAGWTEGYILRLNRSFSLDFSIGVGYTHTDYENYTVIDGVRVRRGTESKNYWGINHAGVTLVWNLFNETKQ